MTTEIIQLNTGQEQDVLVPYGDLSLRLALRFNDYQSQWYCSINNDITQEVIVNGIYLKLDNDALFGLGLDFGTLMLRDSDPTNPTPLNLKNDLGDRIQLIRNFNA